MKKGNAVERSTVLVPNQSDRSDLDWSPEQENRARSLVLRLPAGAEFSTTSRDGARKHPNPAAIVYTHTVVEKNGSHPCYLTVDGYYVRAVVAEDGPQPLGVTMIVRPQRVEGVMITIGPSRRRRRATRA